MFTWLQAALHVTEKQVAVAMYMSDALNAVVLPHLGHKLEVPTTHAA